MDLNALRLEISSAMIGEDVGEEMVSGDEKVEEVIDRRGVTRRKVFMEEGRRAIRDIMGELLTRLWNARLLREPFLCEREKGLLGHLLSQQAPTQGARNGSQGGGVVNWGYREIPHVRHRTRWRRSIACWDPRSIPLNLRK